MEFFFPEDNLTRAVPEETKINSLSAQPYPDGRRLRVNLEVTPFQKRPYIEVILQDANGSMRDCITPKALPRSRLNFLLMWNRINPTPKLIPLN